MKTFQILVTVSLACTALAPSASAGFITGFVVDSNGAGIAGVDIDVKNLGGGGTPPIFNDGTDVNGFFFTTVPDGNYDVIFNPPVPPGSTSLVTTVEDVVIAGTLNMGNVALTPGVALTGRTLRPGGAAAAGVNIDIIDSTGDNIDLIGDTSNALGFFNLAIPFGQVEIRFDPAPVLGATLAPLAVSRNVAGNVNLGTLTLAPGFVVSGFVLRASNGTALNNADWDTKNVATGAKLYTPGDNSNASGFFDFVVPAGTFEFQLCPPSGQVLVSQAVTQTIGANTSLGVFSMQNGVTLSGVVRDPSNQPVAGVDVDAEFAGSGAEVPLCGDNTNGAGAYSVVVPTGVLNLQFSPSFSLPLGADLVNSVNIAGNSVVNGSLPACAFHTNVGVGRPGSGGLVPQIASAGGAPRIDNSGYALQCSNGLGGATAMVSIGFAPTNIVNIGPGISRVMAGSYLTPLLLGGPSGVPGAGSGTVQTPLGSDPALVGLTLRARFFVSDPAASAGLAMSNELRATICP